jgi:uncharacterized membrane protein
MIGYIKSVFKIKSTFVLLVISLFSVLLSFVRVIHSRGPFFLFMLWNLFLAFIPWFIASIMIYKQIKNRFALILLTAIWLVFFPNAPYILTDLMHLGKGLAVPLWYDFILLLSYGLTGMLYGFISLGTIEELISKAFKMKNTWLISIFLIYISCFGIYLGRFLRWNSWDLITNANDVFTDVYTRIFNPFEYKTTWIFTILFGTLLNILYWSYKAYSCEKNIEQQQ